MPGLFRIHYNGKLDDSSETDNAVGTAYGTPEAKIEVDTRIGFNPLTVQFDATNSLEPYGEGLRYKWDFDEDGTIDSKNAIESHTFENPGVYRATLNIRDSNGARSKATVRIEVENNNPIPTIQEPNYGTVLDLSKAFTLKGSATDLEDGELSESSLLWDVLLLAHLKEQTYYYPIVDSKKGNNVEVAPLNDSSVIPKPSDVENPKVIYRVLISLRATDSAGAYMVHEQQHDFVV